MLLHNGLELQKAVPLMYSWNSATLSLLGTRLRFVL